MMVDSSPGLASLGRARKQHGKRTLAKWLRDRGPFSTAHAVDVVLDVCDALAPAHASGIVHGQLGLDSIRFAFDAGAESGPSDLEIFALAADDDSGVTGSHAPFLGPDHRALERPVDTRADIWALGALLYTMLVGAPPPAQRSSSDAPPDGMPLSLAPLVDACLANDPECRPQTVDEIGEKIASFASAPPKRFVRLAERRERRAQAERVRLRLEMRGLAEMPGVLDKLDDAALARAQRPITTAISSIAVGTSTEAAMKRLMTAVHEGTEDARLELASALPALVDFDDEDEDEDVLPTRVHVEPAQPLRVSQLFEPMPLVAALASEPSPALLPVLTPQQGWPVSAARAAPRSRGAGVIALGALAALAISLGAGYLGYAWSAKASAPVVEAASQPAAATAPTGQPTAVNAAPSIPVFAASALPDAPAITPAQLREAKR